MQKLFGLKALWAVTSAALLAGCGTWTAESPRLRVDGSVDRPAWRTLRDVQALPAITQTVTFNSGVKPQTHIYQGTSLWALLNAAGLQVNAAHKSDLLNHYVLATGADGYRAVFSIGELAPEFGNRPSLVAYAEMSDGAFSSLGRAEGPLRTTAPGDVKGGRYVSQLQRLEVRPSGSSAVGSGGGATSSFTVSGDVVTPMQFDEAALQKLPAISQTLGGRVYTGATLWSLLATNTGIKTSAGTKNSTLGMYAVATGSDGYKALVSLGEINPDFGNEPVLVAYRVDGNALGRNGGVRLVVPGDNKPGRSVSNLLSVEVFTATAAP